MGINIQEITNIILQFVRKLNEITFTFTTLTNSNISASISLLQILEIIFGVRVFSSLTSTLLHFNDNIESE